MDPAPSVKERIRGLEDELAALAFSRGFVLYKGLVFDAGKACVPVNLALASNTDELQLWLCSDVARCRRCCGE